MFETFPHAIACSLEGRVVSAKNKRQIRQRLLLEQGVDVHELKNIDYIDAALCALTASYLRTGAYRTYGNTAEGLIVVPRAHV